MVVNIFVYRKIFPQKLFKKNLFPPKIVKKDPFPTKKKDPFPAKNCKKGSLRSSLLNSYTTHWVWWELEVGLVGVGGWRSVGGQLEVSGFPV